MKNFDFFQKSFFVTSLMFLMLFIGSYFIDTTSGVSTVLNSVYSTLFFFSMVSSLAMSVLTFSRDKVEDMSWGSYDLHKQFNFLKIVNMVCVSLFIFMIALTIIIMSITGQSGVGYGIDVVGVFSFFLSYVTAIRGNFLIVKNSQDPVIIEFEKNRLKALEEEVF